MNRRSFIKTGLIWVPSCALAQVPMLNTATDDTAHSDRGSGSGGSPTWYDVILPGAADRDIGSDANLQLFQQITFAAGGTVDKIRFYDNSLSNSTTTVKAALYDGSKNLLNSGSVSWNPGGIADYIVVSITPTVVSSGNYFLGVATSTSLVIFRANVAAGVLKGNFDAFSSFPENPFSDAGFTNTEQMVCSAEKTP